MDLIGAVEALLIFSSIIILPLIYIRVRGNKESSQYQERPSQDWEDTVSYQEGVEYLKVMRHDKEPENDEQKKE
jgi:hypothetical protein